MEFYVNMEFYFLNKLLSCASSNIEKRLLGEAYFNVF